ncbi:hypothetical protein O181_074429 [Austropuccinia psidii MF-1]|uniref:Uncharacterized protein n=1 Tax=Austropuccinia psidii MF-1 TaxID=1389203 RepID=A0A9Q3IDG4_9BASI|nr:hypothetical protein [Austropuccinia psidii MF-1]
MHNCLEGVLAEHFRYQWGFQDKGQEKKREIREANRPRKRLCTNLSKEQSNEEVCIDENESNNNSGSNLQIGEGVGGGFMTTREIKLFQDLMKMVVTPSGPSQLPRNLGCANHG